MGALPGLPGRTSVRRRQQANPKTLTILRSQGITSQQSFPLKTCNIVGGAIIRLIGAVLLEANDEWQLQHRYMQTDAMAELTPPTIDAVPTQIATAAE